MKTDEETKQLIAIARGAAEAFKCDCGATLEPMEEKLEEETIEHEGQCPGCGCLHQRSLRIR